jgi:hypothetical protein
MKCKLILLLLSFPILLQAQWSNEGWLWGLQLGANYSHWNITDLPQTIIPPEFSPSTYSTTEHQPYGFTGNLFLYRRIQNFPWFAFQGDLGISKQEGGYDYEDVNNLKYTMIFKYYYGYLGLGGKIYPLAKKNRNDERWYTGIYVRGGVQFGANLNRENILYTHEPEEVYGPSEYVERELRNVLKGTGYIGWAAGLGLFEIELGDSGWGLGLEGRYFESFGDVIDTRTNGYGFTNQDNRLRTFQATVNLAIPLK